MLRTTTAQKFTSTKIYDLLIGLGAEKKSAEIAIGEFVELVPKALASSTTETGLDTTLPTDKGDIWRLESIISENKNDLIRIIADNKNDTEKIITKNRNDLEKIITKNRNDLEKIITDNKNDTDLKLKDIESKIVETKSNLKETIAKIKSDLELKISESRVHIIKWVIATTLTSTGILIVIIFGLLQFLKVAA